MDGMQKGKKRTIPSTGCPRPTRSSPNQPRVQTTSLWSSSARTAAKSTRKCVIQRLDNQPNPPGLTGYQRVMTAEMPGDSRFELFTDLLGYFLRFCCRATTLRWEFRVRHSMAFLTIAALTHLSVTLLTIPASQSTPKSALNSIGFLPVLPGPCSLFRFKHLGGVMHKYFALTTKQLDSDGTGIVLGNVQLVEDRFPPVLLTFRSKEDAKVLGSAVRVLVFYFEAEQPLGQLVKQRRRWINRTYFVASIGFFVKAGFGMQTMTFSPRSEHLSCFLLSSFKGYCFVSLLQRQLLSYYASCAQSFL